MARAAKQKLARQSTAAYSASQPLFTALYTACNRVGEQRANLVVARDLVQNLHVKLVNQDTRGDAYRQERYMDNAVKAWQSATEIYADIFDQLAQATAAEPSEGKEAREGHAEFAQMARTATAAKTAANSFELYGDRLKAEPNIIIDEDDEDDTNDASENDAESDSSPDSNIAADGSTNPVNTADKTTTKSHTLGKCPLPPEAPKRQSEQPRQKAARLGRTDTRNIIDNPNQQAEMGQETEAKEQTGMPSNNMKNLSANIKYDSKGRKVLWEKGAAAPLVPFGTMDSRNRKEWKGELARQRRERKAIKRQQQSIEKAKESAAANGDVEDTTTPVNEREYVSVHTRVEYEDVREEVEARLKAKKAKNEARKKEKKRKRGSDDFAELNEAAEAARHFAKPPQSKKVKSVDWEAEVATKQKRKNGEDQGDGAGKENGRKRKKRKMAAD